METSVGNTGWGEQWLNAFKQIECDSRLPRGRSYANKGAVTHFEIKGGTISAKVKGSRATPYKVQIEVPAIPAAQAKILLDGLANEPMIISKILNRELDPEILQRATKLKIEVFPSRWRDLKMSCSCPDWAVPCKHLAAVVYLLSREIDGNPFLVFSLKGVDLIQALKARNISIESQAKAELANVASILGVTAPSSKNDAQSPPPTEAYHALNYAKLPDLASVLVSVLPAAPAFFPYADFRALYDKLISRAGKAARSYLSKGLQEIAQVSHFQAYEQPQIVLDASYQHSLHGLSILRDWDALENTLAQLDAASLPNLQPEVAALYHARMASLHLLACGAVVPDVFDVGAGKLGLRWLPAMLDATVNSLVTQLATMLPRTLLCYDKADKRGKSQATSLPHLQQALALCGLFLDFFIQQWAKLDAEKMAVHKALGLFFGVRWAKFDGPGEGATGVGIQLWLARFHLARHTHAPVLCLDEGDTHFHLSLAVEQRSAGSSDLIAPAPMAEILTSPAWQESRFQVLQTVALLAQFFAPLNAYLSAGAKQPMQLTAQDLPAFLFETLPVIRLLGIRALLPKALDKMLRPKLSMRITQGSGAGGAGGSAYLNVQDLFDFEWQIAIGEQRLSEREFEVLVKSAHGIVKFKGEYVYLEPTEIERLSQLLQKPPPTDSAQLLRVALAGEYAGAPVVLTEEVKQIIARLTEIDALPVPAELKAQLRPYQERGFAWLYRNIRAGFGSVIADDMGLGKTLQVITTLLQLQNEGEFAQAKALIVVPTSLLSNWEKEINRFAPSLSSAIYHGPQRQLAKQRSDVLLTTYGTVRTDLAKLKKLAWRVVIVDEAQNIKNPKAAQAQAVKSIAATSFIAMSGTPVENRLSEYWSIMDFANRGMLGSLSNFSKEFALPIERDHDAQVVERFKRVSEPFLLRRLKSDKSIISDLPEKIEQDQYCALSSAQSALYESVLRESLQVIQGQSDSFKRQGLVLQMILALKQICNHPAQFLKQPVANALAEDSGKTELFLALLESIYASHEKVLVFTQFHEMGELLASWIAEKFGQAPQFLHGGVARSKRDEMVERFQHDRTERVFLLSLKAGGTGLNLTAASNVIHYDLWWNPAVEAQATDRAYRIGQQKSVQVHRLITRATFEERINDMIQAKRNLAEMTVSTGEKWIGNLNNDQLREIFSLGT